jgi:hypothetical protein
MQAVSQKSYIACLNTKRMNNIPMYRAAYVFLPDLARLFALREALLLCAPARGRFVSLLIFPPYGGIIKVSYDNGRTAV